MSGQRWKAAHHVKRVRTKDLADYLPIHPSCNLHDTSCSGYEREEEDGYVLPRHCFPRPGLTGY